MNRIRESKKIALKKPGRVFADISNNNTAGGRTTYNARVYCQTHPFLVHKATQGINFIDPLYAERVEATHLQGRPVGHYHYVSGLSSSTQAVEEAEHFWDTIRDFFKDNVNRKHDLILLDLETLQSDPQGILNAFENRIHALSGHLPIVYTGLAYFLEHALVCLSRKFWIAAYPGPIPYKLPRGQNLWAHQYTPEGRVTGIAGNCDKSLLIERSAIAYWT